jgi:bacterioferritin
MSDKKMIVSLLNIDMRDEHAAIVQYLQHAYAIGESGEACEIEAIAREEMRHFDWLAEAIVELGGDPDLARGMLDLSGSGPIEWMQRDVAAEERAIAEYQRQLTMIDDPKIKRLLERILSDERAHREMFTGLISEFEEEGFGAEATIPLKERKAPGMPPHVLDMLQTGVRHEYTVILQYLYHNFVTPHCEIGRELEMQAINEMQHLGWLSEEVAENQGYPDIEHTGMALEGDTAEMLKADIKAEQAVTMDYTRQLEAIEDEGLKSLLTRIREHEVYHDELFNDLLEEVVEEERTEPAAENPEAESDKAPDQGESYTVGSLLDQD